MSRTARSKAAGASADSSASADSGARRPDAADPVGIVLQVQRMSTEDGPGLRSTAFLKGCPLACSWCHNPESIARSPEIQWIGSRCIASAAQNGCGACIAACPARALSRAPSGTDGLGPGALLIDRTACRRASEGAAGCDFACARECPAGAVERLGTEMTASELARELLKDRSYFEASDRGGITLSGGEASAQAAFSREVFKAAKAAGVHTALDTCGFASWDTLADLYPYVDLVLWDLKVLDPARHIKYTNAPVEPILENLKRTASLMNAGGGPLALWIRSPIVPGATDDEDGLAAMGRFVAELDPPRLERWELCAFNHLCSDKYRRLGIEWKHTSTPQMRREDMDRLATAARLGLGRDGIVSWTGSTAIE